MVLSVNQFAMSTVQGQLDLMAPGDVISGQVDSTQTPALVAGQAVKMTSTAGGVPKFVAIASDAEAAYGFVVRNPKDISFAAYANFEVAATGAYMYMTASAAITRGSAVEVVSASQKVKAWAGSNPVIGQAIDTALADGDLIRVEIRTNQNITGLRSIDVTATLAEINAGKTLIPGVAGKKITVVDYTAKVTGAFATGTAIILQSSNGTPVVVSTIAEAALTNGAVLKPTSANTTLGAGFDAPLGTADGLVVANSGSAQTGGTSILFSITYKQI